jgi:hypothetical protein
MARCDFEVVLFHSLFFCLKIVNFFYLARFSNLLYAVLPVLAFQSGAKNRTVPTSNSAVIGEVGNVFGLV